MTCNVLAHGMAAASWEEVLVLRQRMQAQGAGTLSANFLKHADEQTVTGLAAVFRAIEQSGRDRATFANWGVVAAPRFLGRTVTAVSFERFAAEGAWGISPHVIPNRSLHSVSGAISLALGIHGPNLGIGGGPGSESQGLLAAAAMLADGSLPGSWVVLTGWHPELAVGRDGLPTSPSVCRAVALALTSHRPGWGGTRLRVVAGDGDWGRRQPAPPTLSSFGLESLAAALAPGCSLPSTWVWMLEHGSRVELEKAGIAGENER